MAMAKPKGCPDDTTAAKDGLIPREVVDHLEEHFPEHDPVELLGKMRDALHVHWKMLRRHFSN